MREASYMKSPYLSAPKTKHESFFPKIHRDNYRDITRQVTKSNGKQNLFKNDCPIKISKNEKGQYESNYDKNAILKINDNEMQEARIKQSKEYRQLEIKIEEMTRRFNTQMAELEKKNKQVQKSCKQVRNGLYDQKLGFWELKNDVIKLEQILKQEEWEHLGLLEELGYNQQMDGQQVDGQLEHNEQVNDQQENNQQVDGQQEQEN